jgi:hypothetical protein
VYLLKEFGSSKAMWVSGTSFSTWTQETQILNWAWKHKYSKMPVEDTALMTVISQIFSTA